MIPYIDGEQFTKPYNCGSLKLTHEYDVRRLMFFSEATRFSTLESHTLSSVVIGALEQAKRDLVALRLYDLDLHDHAWAPPPGCRFMLHYLAAIR